MKCLARHYVRRLAQWTPRVLLEAIDRAVTAETADTTAGIRVDIIAAVRADITAEIKAADIIVEVRAVPIIARRAERAKRLHRTMHLRKEATTDASA